jgi:hypothetical protein
VRPFIFFNHEATKDTKVKKITNSKSQITNPSLETGYRLSQWGNMLRSVVR